MESKRRAIFLNGIIKDYNYIKTKLRKNDFIIAVDGGIDHIKKLSLLSLLFLLWIISSVTICIKFPVHQIFAIHDYFINRFRLM